MAQFTVTIDHTKVASALTDFPAYIDLSDMPAGFWSTVTSGGGDIRCYQADGTTEIPREVVSCDTGTNTGELHVKADLSSTTDTKIVIDVDGTRSDYSANATYGRENVWDSNYFAVYHMILGNPVDSTSNHNDGSNYNTTSSTGFLGLGRNFNGVNKSIDLPYSSGFISPTTFTLSAYAKPDTSSITDTDSFVVDQGNFAGRGKAIATGSRYGGKWGTYYNGNFISSTTSASDGVWANIQVTYDNSNIRLYVNGALETTKTTSVGTLDTTPMRIGTQSKDSGRDTRWFSGDIDELRYSHLARSADWISAEYNNQSSPSTFYGVTAPIGGNTTNFFRFF